MGCWFGGGWKLRGDVWNVARCGEFVELGLYDGSVLQ